MTAVAAVAVAPPAAVATIPIAYVRLKKNGTFGGIPYEMMKRPGAARKSAIVTPLDDATTEVTLGSVRTMPVMLPGDPTTLDESETLWINDVTVRAGAAVPGGATATTAGDARTTATGDCVAGAASFGRAFAATGVRVATGRTIAERLGSGAADRSGARPMQAPSASSNPTVTVARRVPRATTPNAERC